MGIVFFAARHDVERIGLDRVAGWIVLGGANAKHGGSTRRAIALRIYDVVEEGWCGGLSIVVYHRFIQEDRVWVSGAVV